MTRQELIIYASLKNYSIVRESDGLVYDYIGLRAKNSNVFYWFKNFKDSDEIHFHLRYSQNNGKTSKSFKVGYRFVESLFKL